MTGRVLRIELRRSGMPFWMVPLLVAVLGLVFAQTLFLRTGRWATSIFYDLTPAVVVLAVLTLAVAVWRGGRERRRGTSELLDSTPRPRPQRALAAWLPVVAWPVLAYVPAVAAFGVLSLRAFSGPALFGVLAAAIPMMAAYAALGFTTGWYIPGRFTAPVAGIGAFLVTAFLGARVPPGLLSPLPQPAAGTIALTQASVTFWDRPVWWYALATAVWFTALTATLLTVAMARRRWLAVIPCGVAALVAVPMAGTQMWRIDTTSPLLACSGGTVRVCVPQATGVPLDAVADSTLPVRTRLAGLPTAPRAYVWPQLCGTNTHEVLCDSPAELHPATAGQQLATQTAGWHCPDPARPLTPTYTSPAPRLESGVRAWLLTNTDGTAPDVAQDLAAMPAKERQAWLGRYLTAANTCDTSAIDTLKLR